MRALFVFAAAACLSSCGGGTASAFYLNGAALDGAGGGISSSEEEMFVARERELEKLAKVLSWYQTNLPTLIEYLKHEEEELQQQEALFLGGSEAEVRRVAEEAEAEEEYRWKLSQVAKKEQKKGRVSSDLRIMRRSGGIPLESMRIMRKRAKGGANQSPKPPKSRRTSALHGLRVMKRANSGGQDAAEEEQIPRESRDANGVLDSLRIMKKDNLDSLRIMKRGGDRNLDSLRIMKKDHGLRIMKKDNLDSLRIMKKDIDNLRIMKKNMDNLRIMKKANMDNLRIMKKDNLEGLRIMKKDNLDSLRIMKKDLDSLRIMKKDAEDQDYFYQDVQSLEPSQTQLKRGGLEPDAMDQIRIMRRSRDGGGGGNNGHLRIVRNSGDMMRIMRKRSLPDNGDFTRIMRSSSSSSGSSSASPSPWTLKNFSTLLGKKRDVAATSSDLRIL